MDPSHFRPIAQQPLMLKVFERMIFNRIEPVVDGFIPVEQAGTAITEDVLNKCLPSILTLSLVFRSTLKLA